MSALLFFAMNAGIGVAGYFGLKLASKFVEPEPQEVK